MPARTNRALVLSLIAVITATLAYLLVLVVFKSIPGASGFFGHTLGIFGFMLMLMTETLYSLRKRSRSARWGRVSEWLNFHIFTGITGPYLVLLHTSWKFNGLAGLLTLLTLIVVASGFIGRYIYTALPRSADGMELDAGEVQDQLNALQAGISQRLQSEPALAAQVQELLQQSTSAGAGFFENWRLRRGWQRAERQVARDLGPHARSTLKEWQSVTERQRLLRSQAASLRRARRLLSLWHSVHIPIGMALFAVAFVHIGAALYYATLLR